MDPDPARPSLLSAAGRALDALGESIASLEVVGLEAEPTAFTAPFRARWSDRFQAFSPDRVREAIDRAARRSAEGSTEVLAGPTEPLVVEGFSQLRRAIALPRRSVKVVTTDGGWTASNPPVLEDVALLRGLPGTALVLPADARTAAEALAALVRIDGPAYLRLSPEAPPALGDVPFALGRARELHAGNDLALLAVGPPVELALRSAEELGRVGIQARVLDLASVAPLDEKSILRAARDTGALLTLEEHQAATGLGTLVAALTAENQPVPVRRLGSPDLFGSSGAPAAGREAIGLTVGNVLDEAWELLRRKGKVQ